MPRTELLLSSLPHVSTLSGLGMRSLPHTKHREPSVALVNAFHAGENQVGTTVYSTNHFTSECRMLRKAAGSISLATFMRPESSGYLAAR
jgi:hypothetical protein